MKNTKRIVIVFLVIGLIVLGIPTAAIETGFSDGNTSLEENVVDGSQVKETNENVSAPAQNETDQPWTPQAFAITAAAAFSDSTTSRKVLIVSNSTTQSAGYTETEPASPLDVAGYSSGAWLPAGSPANHPAWYDNNAEPYGSGAVWISSGATTEGGYGDQWRLFQTEFDIPEGSTLTSAQLWYTPDNAAAVYLNDEEINTTGWVYGPRPDYPAFYARTFTANFTPRTGSNTLKFVVRNWQTTIYNPTGLLYKVMIEYEPSTQTIFYVYADGVGLYFDPDKNSNLFRANKTPIEFYTNIVGQNGNPYRSIRWEGIANPVDNATGSRNWNINEDANSMANNADFSLHAGHGWDDGILFGTANPDYKLFRTNNLSFGGNNGKAQWVALFSCNVLNQSAKEKWKSVFNGLHILMGFDTKGLEGQNQGSQFAQRMTGGGSFLFPTGIRESWRNTLQFTIQDRSIKGAYMWARPCENDFLPGFGTFSEPVKRGNGEYNIQWQNFNCNLG